MESPKPSRSRVEPQVGGEEQSSSLRRRLPPDLSSLRNRRPARKPLSHTARRPPRAATIEEESDSELSALSELSELSDDRSISDSSEDEMMARRRRLRRRRRAIKGIPFVSPRCIVSFCTLCAGIAAWSVAISMGVLHQPSYEELARPVRVARQYYFTKTPTSADDGFILFDRDADGLITADDLQAVVSLTSGEQPTTQQVSKYIARADFDGDGALNETEYLHLLHEERRAKGITGPVYFSPKGSPPPSPR